MKDKVEQFIRDLKSVSFWNKCIIDINLELEDVANQLRGVSAISIKPVIYENASNPYKNNKTSLMMLEEQLLKARQKYVDRIEEVGIIFNKIDDITNRNIIIDLYILRKNHERVAYTYNYARRHMYRRIERDLREIIKDVTMCTK